MAVKELATKRDKLEEREAVIIDAATQVFLEKGFDGAKISEIARLADVADGTLYLYFKNKNALMAAVASAHWRRITAEAQRSIIGVNDCFDRLEAHARYHLGMMVKDWQLIDLGFILYYGKRADKTVAAKYKRNYVETFDRVFRQGVDRREIRGDVSLPLARDMFFGTLEYSARSLTRQPGKKEVDAVIENLMFILRSGLSHPDMKGKTQDVGGLAAITHRLESAVKKLETATPN